MLEFRCGWVGVVSVLQAEAQHKILTEVCVLVDDLDMTKSVVARPKFFISVFLARVHCEKLMTRKYFTLLLFMFILKRQPLNLKHPQIRLKNSQAKSVTKMPVFQTLKK